VFDDADTNAIDGSLVFEVMLPYKVCLQGYYFAYINLILHTQITQMDVYILISVFRK